MMFAELEFEETWSVMTETSGEFESKEEIGEWLWWQLESFCDSNFPTAVSGRYFCHGQAFDLGPSIDQIVAKLNKNVKKP